MENQPQNKSGWLEELSSQSWNLELVVSGAAVFSTSFLPQLIDDGITSYFEDYLLSDSLINIVLPLLALGFAKASAYLLIFTFVCHFVFRAFWVAMVGLKAVYPQGINFENLPNVNNKVQEVLQKKFGSLDDYIVRLDKICSQLFSVAFVLVLISVVYSLVYLSAFFVTVFIKNFFPEFYFFLINIAKVSFAILMVLSLVTIVLGSLKSYKEKPIVSKFQLIFAKFNSLVFFGMYKPINYINFVFASNLSRVRYYTSFAIGISTFALLAFTIMAQRLFKQNGLPFLESRSYYSVGSDYAQIKSFHYDNQRIDGEAITDASIQADVIEEPFLKLFVSYNKIMDADLVKICKEPVVPDSLDKKEKRLRKDKARLACISEYFQIAINDSTVQSPDYFYDEHGTTKTKGFRVYIATERFKKGNNAVYIKKMEVDSLPKKVWITYAVIPFWFVKK